MRNIRIWEIRVIKGRRVIKGIRVRTDDNTDLKQRFVAGDNIEIEIRECLE